MKSGPPTVWATQLMEQFPKSLPSGGVNHNKPGVILGVTLMMFDDVYGCVETYLAP